MVALSFSAQDGADLGQCAVHGREQAGLAMRMEQATVPMQGAADGPVGTEVGMRTARP